MGDAGLAGTITGMRRAEVLALRWSDVDLDDGMVSIRRNYVRANGRTYEKAPKTHQMRRASLGPATVEVLRDHRERYEDLVEDTVWRQPPIPRRVAGNPER
ncbi:MAG: hypothetical protein ACRDQA_00265 [Nocardioidaceae bacterium]